MPFYLPIPSLPAVTLQVNEEIIFFNPQSLVEGRRAGYSVTASPATGSLKSQASSHSEASKVVPRRTAVMRSCQPNRTVGRVGRSAIDKKLAAVVAAAVVQVEVSSHIEEVKVGVHFVTLFYLC